MMAFDPKLPEFSAVQTDHRSMVLHQLYAMKPPSKPTPGLQNRVSRIESKRLKSKMLPNDRPLRNWQITIGLNLEDSGIEYTSLHGVMVDKQFFPGVKYVDYETTEIQARFSKFYK